jgi:hypothetical protein
MMNLRGVHDWLMTVISVLYVKRMMDIKRTVDVERMMDMVSDSFGLRSQSSYCGVPDGFDDCDFCCLWYL